MRLHLIYFSLLFWSCNSTTENPKILSQETIPVIKLPLKIRCDDFPRMHDLENFPTSSIRQQNEDTSAYFGKIEKGNLNILIKNKKETQYRKNPKPSVSKAQFFKHSELLTLYSTN